MPKAEPSPYVAKVRGKTKSRLQITPEGAEHITAMYAKGCTIEDIEAELGVGHSTLFAEHNKAIMEEAKATGQARMRNSLRSMQFAKAEAGDTKMLIFLGKQYLGQSEQTAPEPAPVSPIVPYINELSARVAKDALRFKESEEYRAWEARQREEEAERREEAARPGDADRAPGSRPVFSTRSLPFLSSSNCTYN